MCQPEAQRHELPRDTYVIYNGRTVMINSVYSRGGGEEGGVEALKKAVGSLTGVTPDFYVLVGVGGSG